MLSAHHFVFFTLEASVQPSIRNLPRSTPSSTSKPFTSIYRLRPYVAMMFNAILRFCVISTTQSQSAHSFRQHNNASETLLKPPLLKSSVLRPPSAKQPNNQRIHTPPACDNDIQKYSTVRGHGLSITYCTSSE